jgi:hypothetical protein
MNYRSLFADSGVAENNFNPTGKVGLIIANQVPDESEFSDPLDFLIALEEHLMEEHNMTLMQAVKAGVPVKPKRIN